MPNPTGLGGHYRLRYFRWLSAIILGLSVIAACWFAQSVVQRTVQQIVQQTNTSPPSTTPNLPPPIDWDRWVVTPHPPRSIAVNISISRVKASPRINVGYTLTLR